MTKTSIRRAIASTYRRNWSENAFKCVFELGAVAPCFPPRTLGQNVPLLGETPLKDLPKELKKKKIAEKRVKT